MPKVLANLEPKTVWDLFEQISEVSRPSKKEEKIRAWIRHWAMDRGIEFKEDSVGNILLSVPANEGCEDFPTLILQAHMDMVCQKVPESPHNFEKDPIPLKIEEDSMGSYVTADGTTLGADNGIGMAMGLAAITMPGLKHGPLEVLLTVDEETGMTGAFTLKRSFFSGKYLLNLDVEDFGEITISAAGGGETTFSVPITKKQYEGYETIKLEIGGLIGGHSGLDIHQPRSNALKVLVDGLMAVREDVPIALADISGGTVHNAIPRDANATFLFPKSELDKTVKALIDWKDSALSAKQEDDRDLKIKFEEAVSTAGLRFEETDSVLNLLSAIPHGAESFSPEVEDLVETSNNLAVVTTQTDCIEIVCSTRSAIDSELSRIRNGLKELGESHTALVTLAPSYPGWKPDLSTRFLKFVHKKYEEVFGKEVKKTAVHAGLECGLFTRLDPELQIVSIGPEIKGAHSPQERVYIKTVEVIWEVVVKIIESMNDI